MPFLTHAGVRLRYDRTGSGPAVLFIHGWTANRSYWERQVTALRDRHTVVTVDLRGHGESSAPRAGYSLGAMAADLEALVRALAVPRLAVVGWSMGGLVAQELALRLGERVSALALVCTTPGGLADPKNKRADPARGAELRKAVAQDFRSFARGFAASVFKEGTAAPLHAWAVAQMQKTPPHAAEASLEAILTADFRTRLKDLAPPTAVLHGRHDALFPVADAEELAKKIPRATLTIFESSGHAPHLEEPDAFNAALAKALAT